MPTLQFEHPIRDYDMSKAAFPVRTDTVPGHREHESRAGGSPAEAWGWAVRLRRGPASGSAGCGDR